MGLVFINEDNLTATANAIREKTGGNAPYKPAEFAKHIKAIPQNFTPPSKGIMINETDSEGYATDVSIVGYETIPNYYMYYAAYTGSGSKTGWLKNIGDGLHFQDGLLSIGEYSFGYCTGITNIIFPETLTELGKYAFAYCTNLSIDTFPSGLKKIDDYCFYSCTHLNFETLPDSVEYLGNNAFYQCNVIKNLYLPDSIKTIGSSCFNTCSSLQTIKLPKDLKNISAYLFSSCAKLEHVTMPDVIESISNNVFSDCPKVQLDSFNFVGTTIYDKTFYNCYLIDIGNLPDSVTSINQYSFYNCKALTMNKLPSNLKSLVSYSFSGCENITINEIPKGVLTIPNYCFQSCKKITSMNMLGDITSIGSYAFDRCTLLNDLYLSNITKVPTLSNTNAFTNTPIASKTGSIWVPHDLIDSMKAASYWSTYKDIIKGLELKSLDITNKNINSYYDTQNITVLYNNCISREEALGEYAGYTLTCSDNATLDGNILTLNEGVQVGDIVTITATSTYNPEITTTKELEVVFNDVNITVNLNNGQWVDSGTTVDGNIVYKSDSGSKGVSYGKSIATLNLHNVLYLELYIRSYAEPNCDYTEAFKIDTPASRDKGKFSTKNNQSSSTYTKCVYELDGQDHTIDIMYSKDSSGNNGDDRGYFYIGYYE